MKAFEAEEEEIVTMDCAAGGGAELVGNVFAARGSGGVVFGRVGVEERVVEELIAFAMPARGSGAEGGVDGAAAGASVLRVVGVGEDADVLHGFDAGGELPGSGQADGRVVQQKLIGSLQAAVDDVVAVGVPIAQAGEATGAELILREHDAGREAQQVVSLAAEGGQIADGVFVELLGENGGGGLHGFRRGIDGDAFVDLFNIQRDGDLNGFGSFDGDFVFGGRLESGGGDFELIGSGGKEGEGEVAGAGGVRFGGV